MTLPQESHLKHVGQYPNPEIEALPQCLQSGFGGGSHAPFGMPPHLPFLGHHWTLIRIPIRPRTPMAHPNPHRTPCVR